MARRYNHANVLALSMRSTSVPLGREIVAAFLDEPEGRADFDLRNVARVRDLEARGSAAGLAAEQAGE
jgi:ribose 5-phosphate isomerase B